jgi:hypothetical protein
MAARVRELRAAAKASGVLFHSCGSTSTSFTVAATPRTAWAGLGQVSAGTSTSSPGPTPSASSASASAAVPFETATA